ALELGFKVCPESESLAAELRQWLADQQDYSRLAEVLVTEADHRAEPKALELLDEAARLYANELGDPLQAAETLSRALERRPGDLPRLTRMVEHLVSVGDAERAIREISVALESAPAEATASLARMRARLRADEYADDAEQLEAAARDLELALTSSDAERAETYGLLVSLLERMRGLYSDLADETNERRVVIRLSQVLPEVGQAYDALETLASWLREHPTDAEVARHLGQLSEELEDWGTASFAFA